MVVVRPAMICSLVLSFFLSLFLDDDGAFCCSLDVDHHVVSFVTRCQLLLVREMDEKDRVL